MLTIVPERRPWLTQLTQQAIGLLEPVYDSQLASIRESRVIAMDETPIKAGRWALGVMPGGRSRKPSSRLPPYIRSRI